MGFTKITRTKGTHTLIHVIDGREKEEKYVRISKTHKQSYQLLGDEENVVRCVRRLAAAPPSTYTTQNTHAKLTPYVSWVVKRSVCGSVDILTHFETEEKKRK